MPKSLRRLSLMEAVLIILIVLLAALIALPGLKKSKADLNDATAPRLLTKINSAESVYAETYKTGYSSDLLSLGPPGNGLPRASAAGLIDSYLASGVQAGYRFIYSSHKPDASGNIPSYTVHANPVSVGITGKSFYYMDQTGVVRVNPSAPASASDPPFGG